MIGNRKQIPWFQSFFYREKYRKLLRAVFISSLIILLLILGIIYFILFTPDPHYYASTTTGQIIPLFPTNPKAQ